MTYAQDLAKVGLNPDNPDAMYKNLLLYIANPQAFKERDPNWPGKRDNLSWWEEPAGVATINWPFHGGKWYDAAPKNDAQIRAIFRAPQGVGTKQWLINIFHFPPNFRYRMRWEQVNSGFDLFKTATSIVDSAGKFIFSLPGVKDAAKLYVDIDFGALSALINAFVPSPASDILHGLSSVAQDQAKRQIDGLGPKSPPEIVDMILKELHFLGDALVPVRYFVERMLTANRFDPEFFANLLTFVPAPNATDHEKALAVSAKDLWNNNVSAPIKQIVPPLIRMIVSMATTGKIMKSDLLDLIGSKKGSVIDKILDMFGVDDHWPSNVAKATANLPPPPPPPKEQPPGFVATPGTLRMYEVIGQRMATGNDVITAGRKTAGNGTRGWDIALGAMSQKLDSIKITALRQAMTSQDDLKGFDLAASMYAGMLTHPPSKAPADTQVAYFATKGMQGQSLNNIAALTKAVTGNQQGQIGAAIAKDQLASAKSKTTQLLSISGGAVAGLAVAGPIGAPIGAAVGWALGRFLSR